MVGAFGEIVAAGPAVTPHETVPLALRLVGVRAVMVTLPAPVAGAVTETASSPCRTGVISPESLAAKAMGTPATGEPPTV
ncbi:MAG TPA: hypothetical protein VHA75_02075, partial [Rugosimonospora sp.]|nr:hypothetical protein [Rugosimonospora sp.]